MKYSHYNPSQTSFHAISLGENQEGAESASTGFRQSELFELIWIKKGYGAVTVDLENRLISDNSLFCLVPGQINRFPAGQEFVGYKIAFSREFLCADSALPHLPPALGYGARGGQLEVLALGKEMQTEVESIVEMILWEYHNRQTMWAQMLHGLLKVLIGYFPSNANVAGLEPTGNDSLAFNRFMALLDQKFAFQRQVAAYASDLAVSSNYLSEIVKRVSGHSASHHIQQRVLLEAKRKAVSSSRSMKEIALELGFEDSSTFSKFFKTMTQVNFSEFRRGWVTGV
ncbi:AraC-type DNA-binding protein [Dyadobacter soli]|uniref:AraC-type DNA-binding protein n=1 Tax=Dyadobacter soli TaxID=659014 RepID=A0A1G7SLY7_9BACT|nr:helix-turn-helix domain-containing protein [Dyadobacter soli]SDG23961.1 AraC-type DNA-binding protein [Dyadobacter soli]